MSDGKNYLKIEIPPEEPELPARPQTNNELPSKLRQTGDQMAQTAGQLVEQAKPKMAAGAKWGAKKVAEGTAKVTTVVASRVADQVRQEASKISTEDVKRVAQTETVRGLRWLSAQLAKLAQRLQGKDEPLPPANPPA